MQISEAKVWIFVEGKTDRYFYSKLVEAAVDECEKVDSFRVVSADELSADGGGKNILIKFFEFLKSSGNLTSQLADKEARSVFCIDKDADDFLRKRRRSRYIIYTQLYSMENYLFKFGDLVDACSVTLSLPVQDVRRAFPDTRQWLLNCANSWQEWVAVCLFAAKLGAKSANFGSRSMINVGAYGVLDPTLLANIITACGGSASQQADPHHLLAQCRRTVRACYATTKHDRLFNGKWYAHFLEHYLSNAIPNVPTQGIAKRILPHLVQSLNFQDRWARYFRLKLRPHLASNINGMAISMASASAASGKVPTPRKHASADRTGVSLDNSGPR